MQTAFGKEHPGHNRYYYTSSSFVKVKVTSMCEELAPMGQCFVCQVFLGHSVQHLRSGALNLAKLGNLITDIHTANHLFALILF